MYEISEDCSYYWLNTVNTECAREKKNVFYINLPVTNQPPSVLPGKRARSCPDFPSVELYDSNICRVQMGYLSSGTDVKLSHKKLSGY